MPRFATTRWSLVAAAKGPAARQALAELCQLYWYPVYAFVRRVVQPRGWLRLVRFVAFADQMESALVGQVRADIAEPAQDLSVVRKDQRFQRRESPRRRRLRFARGRPARSAL